ncbi:hypothetical protein HCC18_13070 [Listeria booriae]|uniref:hypothetical protein n=1 Tax=Listeria booriae TaxID=1552123 RepID=UPI00162478D1|nr:hypothetical protein [Listeria booriae]MBC2317771.1 hypothetical protein [Listeria booriae]
MSELIVADSDYTSLSTKYKAKGTDLEENLVSYLTLMEAICESAIKDGDVYQNLVSFVEQAKALKGQLENITIGISDKMLAFVDEIDLKDRQIY